MTAKFKRGDVVKTLKDGERYLGLVVTPAESIGLVTSMFVWEKSDPPHPWDGTCAVYIDFDHVHVHFRKESVALATQAESAAFRERGSFALNGHVEKRAYTLLNCYYDYGHDDPRTHYDEIRNPHVRVARESGQPTHGEVCRAINAKKPNPEDRDWSASNRDAMVARAAAMGAR